jgi:hypothetical protein
MLQPNNKSTAVMKSDALALSRLQRTDNEMMSSLMNPPRKSGLNITRQVVSGRSEEAYTPLPIDTESYNAVTSGPETPVDDISVVGTADENGFADDQPTGKKIAPILRKDAKTGKLEIGNFKALALAGGMDECLSIGRAMLDDIGSSNNQLEVLTSSKQITIAKICTTNGSIVISCRSNQVTVSPRHARPDDNCLK